MRRGLVRAVAVVAAMLALVAVLGGLWFRRAVVRTDLPAAETVAVIPSGATGRDVARLLAADHVVSSSLAFEILARIRGERSSLKAGEFQFPAHRSMSDVLEQVANGTGQVALWVTIPEGYTAREIARTYARAGFGNESALVHAFLGGSIALDGTRTAGLEGYLFPDTYLVPTAATPAEIAGQMTAQFQRELPPNAAELARRLGLSVPQVVVVASIVEREAKADGERALMAGVYYNRLRRGMPLQVDATIEYTFAHHKTTITYADLARTSPYNTYRNRGLPPTPIANPGRASLLAAFMPKPSQYLYYVAMGNGHSAFSRTLAEHNANVARYLK